MATTKEAARTGPIAQYHDQEAWLLARHTQGVGSSEVPIILNVDPFGRSQADLQRRKLAAIDQGRLLEPPDNDAMLRGRLFEDDAIELWQMRAERGRPVRRVPLRSDREAPRLLSSADRQALSKEALPTAPLEAKVPGWRMFKELERGGLGDYMNVQGQVHAAVHGAEGTEWAVMRADPLGMLGFWIPADAEFADIIRRMVEDWWQRHIVDRVPAPEVPAGDPLVDLSKLPKVEGKVVQIIDAERLDFLRRMWDARELRDEAKSLYDEQVQAVKQGWGLGVFEGAGFRMYHSARGGGTRLKVGAEDLEQLIDPLRLQQKLVEVLTSFPAIEETDVLEVLAMIADDVRVDPTHYHVPAAAYQEVKLYQIKGAGEAF